MSLTEEQANRYARHIVLPEIGESGQEKLLASKVLLVGVGGLGSPIALYLAAAGIGRIGIVDGDVVEASNLQRQVLHATADLGRAKVESAQAAMKGVNPDVEVCIYQEMFRAGNALEIIGDYDFVIDAMDNFVGKFLLADACHIAGKAYSHAGVLHFDGQTMTVNPGESACYRCIFDAPPLASAEPKGPPPGVLGVLPGVVGCVQATEAIKYLLGIGECLFNRLLVYNVLAMKFREVSLKKNSSCPLCGDNPTITELVDC